MEKIYNLTQIENMTEKQVSSGFFNLKILQKDQNQTEPQTIRKDSEDVDCDCVVLLENFTEMSKNVESFKLKILGQEMCEYVAKACPSNPVFVHFDSSVKNVVWAIKPVLKNSLYTLVLFADTPLVSRKNLLNILDYAKNKGLNVCALPRGYVFKTDYIKRVDEIYSPSIYHFEDEDFISANNMKKFEQVKEILKNRILDFHQKEGVVFEDRSLVYVEPNVSIESGAIIERFVSLCGKSSVGKNALIKCGSVLKNAKIGENTVVDGVTIENAFVLKNCFIGRGSKLGAQTAIKEGSVIKENNFFENVILDENAVVGRNNSLEYLTAKENVCIENNCSFFGIKNLPISLEANAKIKNNVQVFEGVKVLEDQTIDCGLVLKISKEGEI